MRHAVDVSERVRGRYEQVPAILRLDFDHIVREPLSELRVEVGRSSLGRRVDARVGPLHAAGPPRGLSPRTLEVPVRWRAGDHPALFPTMTGLLRIASGGANAIELRLTGEYTPPLGAFGALADRIAGHQAVTASLRSYLHDVGGRLEAALSKHAPVTHVRRGTVERSP